MYDLIVTHNREDCNSEQSSHSSTQRPQARVPEAVYERCCYCERCGRFILSFYAYPTQGVCFRALFLPASACLCSLSAPVLRALLAPVSLLRQESADRFYTGKVFAALRSFDMPLQTRRRVADAMLPLAGDRAAYAWRVLAAIEGGVQP